MEQYLEAEGLVSLDQLLKKKGRGLTRYKSATQGADMPFKVSGPFELKRTPGGIVAFGKDELAAFWEQTAKQTAIDLRTACGAMFSPCKMERT